ncbi:MAG: N-6 DNA methylase [Bacteroidales bacterium]|nr:N-6 DNA methylase [Bacteroidales bacterium]MDD4218210.1 N-6 DNA methylase [Bacteroidales bacterium]MDY0143223.1 N-6 DNA methylase [Bacteroidales bacterium]
MKESKNTSIFKDNNSIVEEPSKNKYGQYFTPEIIANFMISLAFTNNNSRVLEPSCGEGVFLDLLLKRGYNKLSAYELDKELIPNKFKDIIKNESFISAKIDDQFDLIIGNPPYIRWKNLEDELKQELGTNQLWNKHFNSLCDYSYIFILKSIEHLKENGQLIFITPEYWLNTTHSHTLRNYMLRNGYFEEIYHFNETPIFDDVTVSIIIFKFVKSKNKKPFLNLTKYYANKKLTSSILKNLKEKKEVEFAEYIEITQFKENENWLLTSNDVKKEMTYFENKCKVNGLSEQTLFSSETKHVSIGDICDIGNGLVSGLDKAFQLNGENLTENEKRNQLKVVKAKDLKPYTYKHITNYIFLNDIDDEQIIVDNFPNYHNQLLKFKSKLEKRYQYNKSIPYWKWVFLRNFNLFKSDKERIFVPCKERISNKDYFRFAYAGTALFPTQDVTAIFKKEKTKESIFYILAFLNNYRVFQWLLHNGIVKGNIVEFSERPIASIPFRKIDWNNKIEIDLHNRIVEITKEYIKTNFAGDMENINKLFNKLLD